MHGTNDDRALIDEQVSEGVGRVVEGKWLDT